MTFSFHYPRCPVGTRFCQFFPHRFHFIEAPATDDRPQWRTEKRYPIEHRNLWNRWQDPDTLIGVSFGPSTHYALLDIDTKSPYHPDRDERAFKALLGAYEDIGLPDPLLLQSSASEGIHVYFVFPKALPTFDLAVLFKRTAIAAGFEVKDGKLEIFPNPKPYNSNKPTPYKAHRLPLQRGSFLLDTDYCPYSNQIQVFLDRAEQAAAAVDMDLLETALKASQNRKDFRHIRGDGHKAAAFAADLKQQFEEGWSDYGQTNDLLRVIGTYGRVFEGLSGTELRDYIADTAQGLPGYRHYCQHQHEIHRRAKDWARCIEKFYYPYGSAPTRQRSFADMAATAAKTPKENHRNNERQTDAIQRIKEAVEWLRQQWELLPSKVGEMKEALAATIKSLFDVSPSDKTLYRHRELWHPKFHHEVKQQEAETNSSKPEPSVHEESEICHTPSSQIETNYPAENTSKVSPEADSKNSATPPLYMKVKQWFSQGIVLLYQGSFSYFSVWLDSGKFSKVVLSPGQQVVLTDAVHSSFLLYPEDSDRLQVYVQPVELAGSSFEGVPIPAKYLVPCFFK